MHAIRNIDSPLVLLSTITALTVLAAPVAAQDDYLEEILYTIPWGNEIGTLDCTWRFQLPPGDGEELWWAAGKWVVSDSDELLIFNHGMNVSAGLTKFDSDGSLLAFTDMQSVNMRFFPDDFAVVSTGEVLMGRDDQLRLLSPSLELIGSGELSEAQAAVCEIYPSDHGSFWVVYTIYDRLTNYWMLDYSIDGTMSAPELLFQGTDFENCEPCNGYYYVAPDGSTYRNATTQPSDSFLSGSAGNFPVSR